MPAILPKGYAQTDYSIANMQIGDERWVTPSAMFHDRGRGLWLNGNYQCYKMPSVTASMRVFRHDCGWGVDTSQCQESEKMWEFSIYKNELSAPIPVVSHKL